MNNAIFCDRDWTINYLPKNQKFICDEKNVKLLPYAKEWLKNFKKEWFLIVVITNQTGVWAGYYTKEQSQNVNNIIQEVIKNHSQVAFEKKLLFEYECKTDKTVITADEYSVTQIFNNLIDNSINYTKQGKIKIRIFDDYEKLIVEIEDSGIGISEEYLPAIFEPFSQEETGYTRKFDGNGLGLSIVKHFCDLNNAEVSAVSRKGIGSIFTVAFNYNKK